MVTSFWKMCPCGHSRVPGPEPQRQAGPLYDTRTEYATRVAGATGHAKGVDSSGPFSAQ
jgi:hypothetical protein